jgi:glutathione S-transferase
MVHLIISGIQGQQWAQIAKQSDTSAMPPPAPLTLYGWRFSIYTRIARLVLAEKGVNAGFVDVDPFAEPKPEALSVVNPFGLVPVLDHGGFIIFETAAITGYIDDAFPGPALQPTAPKLRARMAQVIGIADAHAYWPLVRQVYAGAVFRPATGLPRDDAAIAQGLIAARPVLAALDAIANEGLALTPNTPITLADLHLAPMIAAFVTVPEGSALLPDYPHLARWWQAITALPSLLATETGLPPRD